MFNSRLFVFSVFVVSTYGCASSHAIFAGKKDCTSFLAVSAAPQAGLYSAGSYNCNTTVVVDPASQTIKAEFPIESWQALSQDGKWVATTRKPGRIEIYDVASKSLVGQYEMPAGAGQPEHLVFSPDGALLAAGYSTEKHTNSVVIIATTGWSARADVALPKNIKSQVNSISGMDFSNDGAVLVYVTQGGEVGVVDAAQGNVTWAGTIFAEDEKQGVFSHPRVAYFDKGSAIIVNAGSSVRAFSASGGRVFDEPQGEEVSSVSLSPDEAYLALGLKRGVRVLKALEWKTRLLDNELDTEETSTLVQFASPKMLVAVSWGRGEPKSFYFPLR